MSDEVKLPELKSSGYGDELELRYRLKERERQLLACLRERYALQARVDALLPALEMMYDKWENGDQCFEDVEELSGPLGNAFRLSEEEENSVLRAFESCGITTALSIKYAALAPHVEGQGGQG